MIWSLIYPIRIGRGHPLSEPGMEIQPKTTTLVTTGPYRYTRNPMVFGYWLMLPAMSFALNSTSFLFILFPCLLISSSLYIVLVEEPWTEKRFGPDYANYKKLTPRFIPRLKIKD
jgi:protein-S-isoprenylcysteine O-methyltransferase Ste14